MDYEIDGRKVSRKEWENDLESTATEQIRDDVERRIEGIRCPAHGKTAEVQMMTTRGQLEFSVSGCCNDLVERVKSALQ